MWSDISNEELRFEYAPQFIKIYGSKIAHETYDKEIIQSFRALVNYFSMYKIEIQVKEIWKPAFDVCMEQIQKAEHILILNNYGELLVKLISLGYVKDA